MARRFPIIFSTFILLSTATEAHTGAGSTQGYMSGFAHLFSGPDHILAMVAVGLYSAFLGGRAMYVVPVAFVSMMAVGGIVGISGVTLPLVEMGIGLSVLLLGAAVALRIELPTLAAMALVGFFAIFHGHAHGSEMPVNVSGLGYAVGFVLATALLHIIGIVLGLSTTLVPARYSKSITQVGGAAIAIAGVGLLLDMI
jgi:urease accessory protein